MTDTTEVQPEPEVPQAPAEAPVESPAPEVPEAAPEEPETAEEEAAEPKTVTDDNGQRVEMPDGSIVYTRSHGFPVSNSEWEVYERTHSGDQARYSLKPGDLGYNPLSDPSVPNSWLAKQIEVQMSSFAERVKTDPNARPSVTWDALQPTYQGELSDAILTGGGAGKVEA